MKKSHINPNCGTKTLQSLQGQLRGIHPLIFVLKTDKDGLFCVSVGTSFQTLGPLYLKVSNPLFTVLGLDGL